MELRSESNGMLCKAMESAGIESILVQRQSLVVRDLACGDKGNKVSTQVLRAVLFAGSESESAVAHDSTEISFRASIHHQGL